LRLLEAEAGDLAHDLDDVDLVRARVRELDVELRLLLGGGSSRGGSTSARRSGDRDGGSLDAPLVLERLDQLSELNDRQVRKVVDNLLARNFSHCLISRFPLWISRS